MRIGIGGNGDIPYDRGSIDADIVPYVNPKQMISDLHTGEIDACVRGNLDARLTLSALKKVMGEHPYRMLVMRLNRQWKVIYPVGIFDTPERDVCESMIDSATNILNHGRRLHIGVMGEGRLEDKGYDTVMDKRIDAMEMLAYDLDAYFYGICLEHAIHECDILIFPNGVVGNYVFRSLHLICQVESYGAVVWNCEDVYVDSSRSRRDYTLPLKLARSLEDGGNINGLST